MSSMVATFVPGSAITAINLNDDFTQLRAIQENETSSDINDADLTRLEARVTQNEEILLKILLILRTMLQLLH